ncbi:MAG: class I SAM-dependent methyltransferase [Hyphomonadaceae bacterium]
MTNPDPSVAMWDARYDRPDYVFGTAPNAFLAAQAQRLKPGWRVLAVADGEGRNGAWLAQQGLVVHAVDASAVAIEKAKRLAAERNVAIRFECADLTTWTWPPEQYDAVVAIFIQFAPPPLRAGMFTGMKRALKPDGLLLLEGYRPEQLAYKTGGPPNAENMYDEALLRAAFGDMEIIELKSYDAEINEGAGHHGISALIDLVARKR